MFVYPNKNSNYNFGNLYFHKLSIDYIIGKANVEMSELEDMFKACTSLGILDTDTHP